MGLADSWFRMGRGCGGWGRWWGWFKKGEGEVVIVIMIMMRIIQEKSIFQSKKEFSKFNSTTRIPPTPPKFHPPFDILRALILTSPDPHPNPNPFPPPRPFYPTIVKLSTTPTTNAQVESTAQALHHNPLYHNQNIQTQAHHSPKKDQTQVRSCG